MKHTFQDFNNLSSEKAREALFNCCGSTKWVNEIQSKMPFKNERQLFDEARKIWFDKCSETDFLEAFSHHPKIGDKENLRKKFASTSAWASNEQKGVEGADEAILDQLATDNETYFQKNGYIFLICATGKSAEEMSNLLSERLKHTGGEELQIAAGEQFKITLLRLQKLIILKESFWNQVSQITTHVLDTSLGFPGKGIPIRLKRKVENRFETMTLGITDDDGRIANLLAPGIRLSPGHYQMCFDTKTYFDAQKIKGFYPKVDIDFTVFDDSHYHVPLLINPFGYSTYRGS